MNGQGLRQKKNQAKHKPQYDHELIDATIAHEANADRKEALQEFKAAQLAYETQAAEAEIQKQREQEELANKYQAKENGTLGECGCCFKDDLPLNRMVHCNADEIHWFCRDCARSLAETQAGVLKSDLTCMSMDGCEGGFSRDQRKLFLDEKLEALLDDIEQQDSLRQAGIENLVSCPFCSFAAECSPIEEDKEFRCQKPDCEIVSCRLCRQETHLPLSCKEAATATALRDGHPDRRRIEEAMSAAIIRKCNKCEFFPLSSFPLSYMV